MTKCDILGHKYEPYEYGLYELIPGRVSPYNRESIQRLKYVYCTRCGIIKSVIVESGNVKYR